MKFSTAVSLAGTGLVGALLLGSCAEMTDAAAPDRLAVAAIGQGGYFLTWEGPGEATVYAATTAADPAGRGREVARSDTGHATVEGLDPNRRWYFEVRTAEGEATVAATRQFTLPGTDNVRDLGGYTTQDGRSVVWGKVFRADDLSDLTPEAAETLEAAEVNTVVDFRAPGEIARDGSARIPRGTRLVNIPLFGVTDQTLADALTGVVRSGDAAGLEEMLGDGESQRIKDEGFVAQLDQPGTMAGYAETLRLIADSPDAVMYHCTAGKDRTGMMTALLLGILGVPDETIVGDFVLSNDYLREQNGETYAYLESQGIEVELVRPLTEQRPSNIQPVIDAVHQRYGGWDGFAADALGLGPATVDKLRDALLE